MQIEVTEKEAHGIYSQRYLAGQSKARKYSPVVLVLVASIVGAGIVSRGYDWLGVAVFIALSAPSILMLVKEVRACSKYAKTQIVGQLQGVSKGANIPKKVSLCR